MWQTGIIERIEVYAILLSVVFVGQILAKVVERFIFPDDRMAIYKPCPVMDEEHVRRFLESFERMTKAQESTVAMLRRVIVLADADSSKLDEIYKKLFESDTEFK